MTTRRWGSLVCGVLVTAALAATVGPENGSALPPLKITPLNGDKTAYDVVEKAAGKPLVVLFLCQQAEENREAVGMVEGIHRLASKHGLHAAVVVLGGDEVKDNITAAVDKFKLQCPIAVLPADDPQLKGWKLDKDLKNMLVLGRDSKVVDALDDVTQNDQTVIGEKIRGMFQ